MQKKAIVLLSGGLDSTTALGIAKSKGFDCHCISFEYGQRHIHELEAAKSVVKYFNIEESNHKIIKIDLRLFGGSALTSDIDVPKYENTDHLAQKKIPITYVPARNTIFLSYALAHAEVTNACKIFVGCNIVDYSHYPDCRPEYLQSFEKMANIASARVKEPITIEAPLLHLDKSQIILEGVKLGIDYSITISCYDPGYNGKACEKCDACLLRKSGFDKLDMKDPALNRHD